MLATQVKTQVVPLARRVMRADAFWSMDLGSVLYDFSRTEFLNPSAIDGLLDKCRKQVVQVKVPEKGQPAVALRQAEKDGFLLLRKQAIEGIFEVVPLVPGEPVIEMATPPAEHASFDSAVNPEEEI